MGSGLQSCNAQGWDSARVTEDPQRMRTVVGALFLTHLVKAHVPCPVVSDYMPLINMYKLKEATILMRHSKALEQGNVLSQVISVQETLRVREKPMISTITEVVITFLAVQQG